MPDNPPAYPESIGHFRLTGFLGEGGMGVVYRAKDTQLNRDVALKLLSPAFAKDHERLARFTREAQVLASLNHPGIGAVYGVEEKALVLELVLGPTLAERITQGAMPFSEALPLIGQLIDAIEYAHEKGVIHRDFKPANIKLTADDGQVKILDFGLAKALSAETAGSPANPSDSPTLTMRSTEAGLILGTAAYMAPEQARGKTVDKRADIWSFGVVVYELLTGRRLFQGETVTDTLAQTLTKEVDWGIVPPEARRLLGRCLDRDPKSRLRDIGDARELLRAAPALAAKRSGWLWSAAGVALALAVGGAAGWWWAIGQRPETSYPALRAPVGRILPFASPDGKWLVGATQESSAPLQLRRLDTTSWRTLAGTEGASLPFWSADSTAFGYFVSGQLRLYVLATRETRTLANAPRPGGGAWRGALAAGDVLFSSEGKLHHLRLPGNEVRVLPIPLAEGVGAGYPTFLPEGDGFVFLSGTQSPDGDDNEVLALFPSYLQRSSLTAASAKPEQLLRTAHRVAFARRPGHAQWYLLYSKSPSLVRRLMAAPVDPRSGTLLGDSQLLVEGMPGVRRFPNVGIWDAAREGLLFARLGVDSLPIWTPRWYNRSGKLLASWGEARTMHDIYLSPDEKWAILRVGQGKNLLKLDLEKGQFTPFTSWPDYVNYGVWSPDGKYFYYTVAVEGSDEGQRIVRQPIEGPGTQEVIGKFPGGIASSLQAVSPDGRYLVYRQISCIYTFDLKAPPGTEAQCLIPATPEFQPGSKVLFILGGRWLYVQNRLRPGSAYLVRWPIPPGTKPEIHSLVAKHGHPLATSDGKELCHATSPRSMLICQSISETATGPPQFGPERDQFVVSTSPTSNSTFGAISNDGKRFFLISTESTEVAQTEMISDWSALIEKKAP